MLYRHFHCPNESFRNGMYKMMDTLCFAEFLYLHYLMSKSLESGNDCQSVILDDVLVEMNHAKSNFWKVIPPIS